MALLGASQLIACSVQAAHSPQQSAQAPPSATPAQSIPSAPTPVTPATGPTAATVQAPTPAAKTEPGATPPAVQQQNAQQQSAQEPSGGDAGNFVLRVQVNEVNLVFTVTDKRSGRFVKNLHQQDFELLDAGKPPVKVVHFIHQTNLPMRVGLLIDTSSSVHSRFDFEQRSAIDFLQQILRPQQDLAFVMGFDSSPEMTQPFTSDVDKLATGINGLKSNGGTALYDALYTACRDELLPIKNDEPMRKTIVLLSDGHDNQSRVHEDEAIKMCQRAAATVYTISTNVSPTKDVGDDILAKISESTGGRTFVPLKEEDVARAFYEISDELRAQYALVYTPADFKTNGQFRDIWLMPVDRNKYLVRAPKGYFAAREQ
jgi:VWFA-related protein